MFSLATFCSQAGLGAGGEYPWSQVPSRWVGRYVQGGVSTRGSVPGGGGEYSGVEYLGG